MLLVGGKFLTYGINLVWRNPKTPRSEMLSVYFFVRRLATALKHLSTGYEDGKPIKNSGQIF